MAPRMAAALALLALVGLASNAEFGGDQALSTSEFAFVALVLAVAATLVLGVGTLAWGGGSAIFGDNRRKLVAALLFAGLVAAIIALLLLPIDAPPDEGFVPNEGGRDPGNVEDPFRVGGDPFRAIAAAVVAGLALLLAALVVLGAVGVAQRRRRASVTPRGDEEEAVMQAVDLSLDDLRREPDVRRAIIACYARMERALERAGSARRPAEAPFEYLVRVLERITANDRAARAVTELFEQAKFSLEPMGEHEKQQAIDALELLRAEVSQTS